MDVPQAEEPETPEFPQNKQTTTKNSVQGFTLTTLEKQP